MVTAKNNTIRIGAFISVLAALQRIVGRICLDVIIVGSEGDCVYVLRQCVFQTYRRGTAEGPRENQSTMNKLVACGKYI